MSFRIEEKIQTDRSKLVTLIEWIYKNGGHPLYPPRTVSSTYFDNENKDMFNQSEEGSLPRKKIRVRAYSKEQHSEDNSRLETKISSIEGRFKTEKKLRNISSIFRYGLADSEYGILKPVVRVTYERSYYSIYGVRLTIDRNLKYQPLSAQYNKFRIIHSDAVIVEIKAPYSVSNDFLSEAFPFPRARFSKYCLAVRALYK
jgi:SPX domain protein involved in polyphosphate accumulation